MSLIGLVLRNIRGNAIRSLMIFLCVVCIASFFVSTTLIIRGAELSLQRGLERLGADILVVPVGAESKVETVLLMGKPARVWMPKENMEKLATIPGVDRVSPQIYLSSLHGSSCCAVSGMSLVVFDPETDFTISPWLQEYLGRTLAPGEVIGGKYVSVPPGEKSLRLYNYNLTLVGNLEATGTGIDRTVFMTLETAYDMAKFSLTAAEEPLEVPSDVISTVLVKTERDADPHRVALRILFDIPGVVPIESPDLFGAFRQQILGLLWGLFALLIIAWILSIVLLGLIFSMAVNERQREIAVIRALGATRNFVFRSLLAESSILAMTAGAFGIVLTTLGIFVFRDFISDSLGMPYLFPSLLSLSFLFVIGVFLSLLTVVLAAFVPALKISLQEPAIAMKE